MIIGAHNAWSYLPVSKWWMKPISFTARCQRRSIKEQYIKYNVRCFDLRIRFSKEELPVICHGIVEYKYSYEELLEDLKWLQSKGDVIVRLLLELRSVKKKDWSKQKQLFNTFYNTILKIFFPNIEFIKGRSLPDWDKVIKGIKEGNEVEDYASVSNPKYIDDWIPILYASINNKKALKKNIDKEILLIDFVDIC